MVALMVALMVEWKVSMLVALRADSRDAKWGMKQVDKLVYLKVDVRVAKKEMKKVV